LRLWISVSFLVCSVRQSTDRPIRVRFEHTRYPQWGGASGYTQLTRTLDSKSFRAVLHGASDSDADLSKWLGRFKGPLKRFTAKGGMRWYKLSDLNAELTAFAAALARRFEIVHFLDGDHSPLYLPRLLRLIGPMRPRVIATFHQPPEIAASILNGSLLRWFDHVVVVSPSQLPFFRQHVAEDRLHVILHGVNAEFFRPAAAPNRTRTIRCVTVGHWLRNWGVFEDVARALSDISFDVVTGGGPDLSGLLNVRRFSGLSDHALADLYRSADILFLPLEQTTANNALLEGIASGLPVVATDLEATRAYLPAGEAILIQDNSVDDFVSALRHLQVNVTARLEMGHRARLRAETLSWGKIVLQYESLYRKTIGDCRASRQEKVA
jgi:glycosyltransferase involved in cell wall biosynthesis